MKKTQKYLHTYAVSLADDALMLGQRLGEWCGNGPFLEEDIALSNVALDFLGRADLLYQQATAWDKTSGSVDELAMLREIHQYRNLLLYELPNGDFAFTCARQFLLDTFEHLYFTQLCHSTCEALVAIAEKTIKEIEYHLRRSRQWIIQLGDGSDESHRRLQTALDEIWIYSAELFQMSTAESQLLAEGISVDRSLLEQSWDEQVKEILHIAGLQAATMPADGGITGNGREGIHTEHLGHLLSELQYMQRTYPGLQW